MPANSRWDLIRRLRVKGYGWGSSNRIKTYFLISLFICAWGTRSARVQLIKNHILKKKKKKLHSRTSTLCCRILHYAQPFLHRSLTWLPASYMICGQRPTFVVSMKVHFICLFWSWVEGFLVLGCRPLSVANRASHFVSLYLTLPTYHWRFLGWKLIVRFMTDGFKPPVTEASNRCTWCNKFDRLHHLCVI